MSLIASFPDGFIWGAAASAYRPGGAWGEDGKGGGIWERFRLTRGRIANGDPVVPRVITPSKFDATACPLVLDSLGVDECPSLAGHEAFLQADLFR